MNVQIAAIATATLVLKRMTIHDNVMAGDVEDPTSMAHAAMMLTYITAGTKCKGEQAHRWLGWAQCIVCQHKVATLEELKEINHKA